MKFNVSNECDDFSLEMWEWSLDWLLEHCKELGSFYNENLKMYPACANHPKEKYRDGLLTFEEVLLCLKE